MLRSSSNSSCFVWEPHRYFPNLPITAIAYREGAAGTSFAGGTYIFVHGGLLQENTSSPVETLSAETWICPFLDEAPVWKKLPDYLESGPTPTARAFHVANAFVNSTDDIVYIFGGATVISLSEFNVTNELFSLDVGKPVWRKHEPKDGEPWPVARAQAVSQNLDELHIILYGGITGVSGLTHALSDVWIYNMAANKWTEIQASVLPPLTSPPARNAMTALLFGADDLAVWGGSTGNFTFYATAVDTPGVLHLNLSKALSHGTAEWSLQKFDTTRVQTEFFNNTMPNVYGAVVARINATAAYVVGGQVYYDYILQNAYVFNMETAVVEPVDYPGSLGRSFAAAVNLLHTTVVFGGKNFLTLLNDLFIFSPYIAWWFTLSTEIYPTPASGLGLSQDTTMIYVFGGFTGAFTASTLWSLDLSTGFWSPVLARNVVPPGRTMNIMALYKHTNSDVDIYIYGGSSFGGILGDLWLFQNSTMRWTEMPTGPAMPPRRGGAGGGIMTSTYNCKLGLYVFGGYFQDSEFGTFYNDSWIYCFKQSQWLQIESPGNRPVGRCCFASTIANQGNNSAFYVYGGYRLDHHNGVGIPTVFDDVWVYYAPKNEWHSFGPSELGPRWMAASCLWNGRWIVFGGSSQGCMYPAPYLCTMPVAPTSQVYGDMAFGQFNNVTGEVSWTRLDTDPTSVPISGTGIFESPQGVGFIGGFTGSIIQPLTDATYILPRCADGSGVPGGKMFKGYCEPCPKGTYSVFEESLYQGGGVCTSCPDGTTTAHAMSTSVANCSHCVDDYCHGQGTCSVFLGEPVCECLDGWTGRQCMQLIPSDGRSTKSVLTVVFGVLAGLIAIAAFAAMFVYYRDLKTYHIFISYRVASDARLAYLIAEDLQARFIDKAVRIRCFLDAQDISDGSNWEKAFMQGLSRSCLFLPLVSARATEPIEHVSMFDKKADNFLLEIETALALYRKRRIAIFPLFVGQWIGGEHVRFPDSLLHVERFPSGPSKTCHDRSVQQTMQELFKIQGQFVPEHRLDESQIERIVQVLKTKAWDGKGTEAMNFKRSFRTSASPPAHPLSSQKTADVRRDSLHARLLAIDSEL